MIKFISFKQINIKIKVFWILCAPFNIKMFKKLLQHGTWLLGSELPPHTHSHILANCSQIVATPRPPKYSWHAGPTCWVSIYHSSQFAVPGEVLKTAELMCLASHLNYVLWNCIMESATNDMGSGERFVERGENLVKFKDACASLMWGNMSVWLLQFIIEKSPKISKILE